MIKLIVGIAAVAAASAYAIMYYRSPRDPLGSKLDMTPERKAMLVQHEQRHGDEVL